MNQKNKELVCHTFEKCFIKGEKGSLKELE